MGELTHKAARAAFGKAIDLTLKHVEKDRENGLLQLVDLTEKFMGNNFPAESYVGARNPSGCSMSTVHWMRSIRM